MKTKRKVVWDVQALTGMKEAYDFIKGKSPRSSSKLKQEIKDTLEQIQLNPNIFQADRFVSQNQGDYRAFEIWSYRVSYRITDTEVYILRVRHTSRSPIDG